MMNTPKKILVLSANPFNTSRLQTDAELAEVWRRLQHARQYEVIFRVAVTVDDLRGLLLDENPQILHFSGHGKPTGLVLDDGQGHSRTVTPKMLRSVLAQIEPLACIFLNACHSQKIGEAIQNHADCVIAMQGEISDFGAREFTKAFYDGLARGRTYPAAFQLGQGALEQEDPKQNEAHVPLLLQARRVAESNLPGHPEASRGKAVESAFPSAKKSVETHQFAYDIFLSHNNHDKPRVRRLAERLREAGLRVWFDEWVVKGGDDIYLSMERGLAQSRVLVLCMSAHAFGSDWVRTESRSVLFRDPANQERRFIPLRLESCEVPDSIRRFKALDWWDEDEGVIEELAVLCGEPKNDNAGRDLQSRPECLGGEGARAKMFQSRLQTATGEETQPLNTLPDHSCLPQHLHSLSVRSIAWSRHGMLAVAVGNTVQLWDSRIRRCVRIFSGHTGDVNSVDFSADGIRIVSGSDDQTLRVWDAASGGSLQILQTYQGKVNCVAFAPDGKRIVSGSDNKTLRIWNAENWTLIHTLRSHLDNVNSVAFAADGKWIVSGSKDKTVRIWDAGRGTLLHILAGHEGWVRGVAVNGERIVSCADDRTVRVWDMATKTLLHTLTGHTQWIFSVAFSSDGQRIVSGAGTHLFGKDNTVRIWDATNGTLLQTLEGHEGSISSVAFSPDSKQIVSGSHDNTIRVWNVVNGMLLHTLTGYESRVQSVVFASDGRQIISGASDNTIRVWDVMKGILLHTFTGHEMGVKNVALASDSTRIVSASEDKTVRIWDARDGTLFHTLNHEGWVYSVAFSPDNKKIASGSGGSFVKDDKKLLRVSENILQIWDAVSGALLHTLTGHEGWILSVTFSVDGKRIVTGSRDKTVRIWDATKGTLLGILKGHTGNVNSVAFARDGRQIVSGSEDNTVRVWDSRTSELLKILRGHTDAVICVMFSPDDKRILSGSQDGTLRLWDIQTGDCIGIMLSLPDGWLTYTPDGRYKYGGNINLTEYFWFVDGTRRIEFGELSHLKVNENSQMHW